MNIRKIITFIFTLNLLAWTLLGQADCICPKIEVTGPSALLNAGETAVFTAKVTGDKGQSTYNWTLSSGTIIKGQGTPAIEVDTRGLEGQDFTATVTVGGWCAQCAGMTMSAAAAVEQPVPKPQARLVADMKNPVCEERQMMMDNYFMELNSDPSAMGHIFTFGSPRRVARVESAMRANLKWRGFPADRIVFVNGGGRSKKPTIHFWIVPAGAEPPTPELPDEDEADFDIEKDLPEIVTDPKEPYIFSSEYYDGGGCIGETQELDLEGFAKKLKENPKSRANIVILMMSKSEFREKEKEILSFLAKKGIARNRLRTFHQKTFGGVELWLLPGK